MQNYREHKGQLYINAGERRQCIYYLVYCLTYSRHQYMLASIILIEIGQKLNERKKHKGMYVNISCHNIL